jgi:hypothetical protein
MKGQLVTMKCKGYRIMGTVQKLNRKVVDRDKLDTPNKPIHDRLRSWLDAGTSIKSGGVI